MTLIQTSPLPDQNPRTNIDEFESEDARKAREAVPRGSNAAHAGEVAGEGVSNIDEAVCCVIPFLFSF